MPLRIFTIYDPMVGQDAYNDWISKNPGIKIITKHLVSHGVSQEAPFGREIHHKSVDHLYVFYEEAKDAEYRKNLGLITENGQLEMCRDIARAMLGDAQYAKLKNSRQRTLYLLDQKNLPKDDADTVENLIQMHRGGAINLTG